MAGPRVSFTLSNLYISPTAAARRCASVCLLCSRFCPMIMWLILLKKKARAIPTGDVGIARAGKGPRGSTELF